MSEQLELFIGHPPGDEPGKTKIADATASSSWNVNFNNGFVYADIPPERVPGSSPRRNR